jgi:hypothetical protein
MTPEQFDEFSPFWGRDAKRYLIVRLRPDSEGVIFDKEDRAAWIIEDDDLATEVKRRMIEAGVEVVSKLPVED